MRYNLESTLPIDAFSPRGGRNNPFARGMTLEGGGGGGGVVGKVFGGAAKAVTGAVKSIVQPVYNATLKQIPGVDKALVNLDKSVGKAIPGGWGTIASVAASFIPGAQLAALGMTQTGLATGLGALTGSGVMRKGNQFNLQGALMGGAAAYGLSSLGEYAKAASNAPTATPTVDTSGALTNTGGSALTGTGAGYTPSEFLKGTSIGADAVSGSSSLTPTANALANSQFTPPPLSGSEMFSAPSSYGSISPVTSSGISPSLAPAGAGSTGAGLGGFSTPPSMLDKVGTYIANAPGNIADSASNFLDKATTGSTYTDLASGAGDTLKGMGSNIADTGAGIKNLVFGPAGTSAAAAAASGVSPSLSGAAALYGTAGLAALDEQRNYLDQQLASNNIAQEEYNTQVAEIDRQIDIARKTMAENPWNTNPDRSATIDPTAYARVEDKSNLYDRSPTNLYENQPSLSPTFTAARGGVVPYAMGGSIDDENGFDEARGLSVGNMRNGFMGGSMPSYAMGGNVSTPRFLSGGGDGMSDSIPASINGKQEARLADGEFVVPADVVSHLGNGSSKAGAKRLYSMMDKVRKARTGTKKQGKQINPNKFMPA